MQNKIFCIYNLVPTQLSLLRTSLATKVWSDESSGYIIDHFISLERINYMCFEKSLSSK